MRTCCKSGKEAVSSKRKASLTPLKPTDRRFNELLRFSISRIPFPETRPLYTTIDSDSRWGQSSVIDRMSSLPMLLWKNDALCNTHKLSDRYAK